jgi:aminoglycoside phosphotransferase (APT) family kinase protein
MSLASEVRRRRPPAAALAWVEAAVGREARVSRVRALDGGTSAALHAVDVDAGGVRHRLVLRRHLSERWLADEPDIPAREADALGFLAASPLPTPGLVAVDPTGTAAGEPSVLMTRLAGRMSWVPPPGREHGWLGRLAAILPEVHAVTPAGRPAERRYLPYYHDVDLRPPAGTRRRHMWERAISRYHDGPPEPASVFIHRDFHPGNVLWSRGRVSGVLDWIECCMGAPGADVGHCRHNLVRDAGTGAAESFLRAWLTAFGVDAYDPWWDLVSVLDWGESAPEREPLPPAVEHFLAAALAASP